MASDEGFAEADVGDNDYVREQKYERLLFPMLNCRDRLGLNSHGLNPSHPTRASYTRKKRPTSTSVMLNC